MTGDIFAYPLTIVCSDAILYNTMLQGVMRWNQKNKHDLIVKLSYLSPKEWDEIRKAKMFRGTIVLLEGLPWKLRPFIRIRQSEDLGYGVKLGYAKDFFVITANSSKLFSIRKYDEFCTCLTKCTGRQIEEAGIVFPGIIRNLLFISFFLSLKNAPILAVVDLLLLAWLSWEDKKVKQLQCLYGAMMFLKQHLEELENTAKPADIE